MSTPTETRSATVADPFDVQGRVAIVTGASSGLGERFARVLAARGATVVAAARRVDRLERLASEVEGVLPVACDVADDAALARLVERTVAEAGEPAILVNCAGVSAVSRDDHETPESFRRVVDVNLTATYVLSSLVARRMIAGSGGSIVNVASMMGLIASAPVNQASYCASKGGVVNLTRELAVQWAREGVRVNAIAPGFFPSEMTGDPETENPKFARWILRNTPMGRLGEAQELDGALLLLASDAGAFLTGQTITVDGGFTAR